MLGELKRRDFHHQSPISTPHLPIRCSAHGCLSPFETGGSSARNPSQLGTPLRSHSARRSLLRPRPSPDPVPVPAHRRLLLRSRTPFRGSRETPPYHRQRPAPVAWQFREHSENQPLPEDPRP